MAKASIPSLLIIYLVATGFASAQSTAFEPTSHDYIYDIQSDGTVRCTWSTTIIPNEQNILYSFYLRGGETGDFQAEDSMGQVINAAINDTGDRRIVSLPLAGYPVGLTYKFNLSFTWDGLLDRDGERNTLYTSVNVGEPQGASIAVILPEDAIVGTSAVTLGNSTEAFERKVISGRDVLSWNKADTGNETDIVFRADYDYYNAAVPLSDNMLYEFAQAQDQPFSLAIPVENLNGTSAWDILMINMTNNAAVNDNEMSTRISALNGSDGSMRWQKEYQDALAYAFPAGDLNGDGKKDIVIDVVLAGTSFVPYSRLIALNGCNGTEIWERSNLLAATVAYPLNSTGLLTHVFGVEPINRSVITRIDYMNASDGKEVGSRTFPGAIAVEYAAGNLTDDRVQDSILAVYKIDIGPNIDSYFDFDNNIPSTRIAALDGVVHSEAWNRTFDGLAIAMPTEDLTGDGIDDLVIYEPGYNEYGSTEDYFSALEGRSSFDLGQDGEGLSIKISAISGKDGIVLWQRFYNESLAIAFIAPDLTGDGTKDLAVYKLGASGTEAGEMEAVNGDDGRLLWSRPSMLLLPQ